MPCNFSVFCVCKFYYIVNNKEFNKWAYNTYTLQYTMADHCLLEVYLFIIAHLLEIRYGLVIFVTPASELDPAATVVVRRTPIAAAALGGTRNCCGGLTGFVRYSADEDPVFDLCCQ